MIKNDKKMIMSQEIAHFYFRASRPGPRPQNDEKMRKNDKTNDKKMINK